MCIDSEEVFDGSDSGECVNWVGSTRSGRASGCSLGLGHSPLGWPGDAVLQRIQKYWGQSHIV